MRFIYILFICISTIQISRSCDYLFYLLEWNLFDELQKHIEKDKSSLAIKNNKSQTLLHVATLKKNYTLLEYFIEKGGNLAAQDYQGATVLHYLCQSKTPEEVIQYVLRHKININLQDKLKRTALWYACQKGHFYLIVLLLKQGADPNIYDHERSTPLFFARNQMSIKTLLQAGANLRHKNIFNKKAFESFDYYDMSPSCIFYLLAHNYKCTQKHHYNYFFNKYTYTPFLMECATNAPTIKTILTTKISIEEAMIGLLWAHVHRNAKNAQTIYNSIASGSAPYTMLQRLFTNLCINKHYEQTFCLLTYASPQEKSAILIHLFTKIISYYDLIAEHLLYSNVLTNLLTKSIFTTNDSHALISALKHCSHHLRTAHIFYHRSDPPHHSLIFTWTHTMLQRYTLYQKINNKRLQKQYTDCICETADIYEKPKKTIKKRICCIS